METALSPSLLLLAKAASFLTRIAIVLLLLAMLPTGMLTYAAAGATLSDPSDSALMGAIILVYLAADIAALAALASWHRRNRVWLLAASIAVLPVAVLAITDWVRVAG